MLHGGRASVPSVATSTSRHRRRCKRTCRGTSRRESEDQSRRRRRRRPCPSTRTPSSRPCCRRRRRASMPRQRRTSWLNRHKEKENAVSNAQFPQFGTVCRAGVPGSFSNAWPSERAMAAMMGKTAMMPKARAAEMAPLYALMPKGGEENEAKTMRGRRRSGGKRSEGSKGGGERKKGAALGPRGDRRPMPRRDVPTHPAASDEGWVFPGRRRRRARWWQRERQCFSGNRRVFHPLNPLTRPYPRRRRTGARGPA